MTSEAVPLSSYNEKQFRAEFSYEPKDQIRLAPNCKRADTRRDPFPCAGQPAPSWIGRLRRLIAALGLRPNQWRSTLGSGPYVVRRILRGAVPKVLFLHRLAALEKFYAREIEALERGEIVVKGRRRFDWREPTKSRPPDLQGLGVINFSREP